MPWNPDKAEKHTRKARTAALKELLAKVANERLQRTGDEGRAIREANAVVAPTVRWWLTTATGAEVGTDCWLAYAISSLWRIDARQTALQR